MTTNTKILASKVFVGAVLFWLCFLWWQKEDMTLKEMQIMSIAETHAEKGFGFTRGYNVYPEHGGKYSDIDHTKQGGVQYFLDSNYTAYVSVPVLVPISAWLFYDVFNMGVHASKAVFLLFSFVCLWLFFKFGDTYIPEKSRAIFNLFILSPFFLFNYFYNDINLNSFVLGFSLMTYMFFLKYLETGKRNFLVYSALCLLVNIWSSFFVISLFPLFFLHLLFDKHIAKQDKTKLIAWFVAISACIIGSVVIYYALLPGAVEKTFARVNERIVGVEDVKNYEEAGNVPLIDFISKLMIRLNSHFSPIAFLLSVIGLLYAAVTVLSDLRKTKFAINTLDIRFILLMFFLMGVPSSLILYTGSFIHPYFTFQWIPFFVLGSYMGLNFLIEKFPKFRTLLVTVFIGAFLLFSIPRSYAKVTGKSLIDLLFNGEVPSWYKKTS